MTSKGKFIVIEGTDGSGKTTQLNLLKEYLTKNDKPVEVIDFPRYWTSFHGRTIKRYLDGEFGKIDEVSPYLISLAYSLDRATAKGEIKSWLKEGKIVLADRYASSNLAHQAAKLPAKKRDDFVEWDLELEYKINKIIKEDLVIYLHVPVRVTQTLLKQRGGNLDIHERNLTFLEESQKMYVKLAKRFRHWVVIDCVTNEGIMRSKEDIHEEIVATLKKKNII